MQLGIIYEMIGDGTEAGRYLREGEAISKSLDLPLFVAAFSSILSILAILSSYVFSLDRWYEIDFSLMSCDLLGKLDTQTTQCGLLDKTTFGCSTCQLFFKITLSEYTEKGDEENMFESFLNSLIKAKFPGSESCLNFETEVLKCICRMGSQCDETFWFFPSATSFLISSMLKT